MVTSLKSSEITRDETPVDQVSEVRLVAADFEHVEQARNKNPLRRADHTAFGCRDPKETRNFYEGILGLPLINAFVLEDDVSDIGGTYCHFFFELGNGNSIAFFDHTRLFKSGDFEPKSGFHQHIAFEVDRDEQVQEFRSKLTKAGIENVFIDHGVYHSVYFTDPNNINLEITWKCEGTAEFEMKSRKIASDRFEDWLQRRPAVVQAEAERR